MQTIPLSRGNALASFGQDWDADGAEWQRRPQLSLQATNFGTLRQRTPLN
jgi:hypothetical protein